MRRAIDKGFEVVACVYNNNSDKYLPNNVLIKKGDVMNYEYVTEAMNGAEVVISVLGHIKGSDPLMQTKGMQNIVKAMQNLGIKRVLSLTGTGARVPGDAPSVIDKVLNFFVKLVDPDRINDGIEHVKVLQNSGLNFSIVRVLKLSKSDKDTTSYVLTEGGPAEIQTSRKKVAKVLVDLIKDQKYIGKFPVISG